MGVMTQHSDGEIRALRALVLAADLFRQTVADAFGVGPSDLTAMSHLRSAGRLNARELASRTGLTPSTVTALLRRLEAAGLAERTMHPTDRRQVVVALTAKGGSLLDRSEGWLAAVLTRMGQDVREAEGVLVALRTALEVQEARIREELEADRA